MIIFMENYSMKIKNTLLALSALLAFNVSFAQDERAYSCSHLKSHHDDAGHRSARLSDEYIAITENYDVHFYELDLEMERTSTYVQGVVQIHATALVDMDVLIFELWDDFFIEDVILNGMMAVPYTREESAVVVPVAFGAGEEFFIEVIYEGSPPTGGGPLGGGGMTNASSPSWGNQVTWSLSEPFAAYEWFPCKQSLTDKADSITVKVTTSAENMVGSNGLLTAVVPLPGGKERYEWHSNYPIDYYLISISIARYVEHTIYAEIADVADPVMIQNFIYDNPDCLPYFLADINQTADFIELFSDVYGPYPFHNEKYGHSMAPIGGGMEHQTMTTQGYFAPWLTAHELGHQWFGDHVTCGSWSDIWLNEGFASYSEEIMLAAIYGDAEAGASMEDRHNNVMGEPGGSVWVEDSLTVNRIFSGRLSYDKGAAIVHTLRFLINDDDVFYEMLRTYQTEFANSTARLADFKGVAETVTGLDLTAFFNEWYYGEGYPTYEIEYAHVDGELIVLLRQNTSMDGVTPYFTNDIELEVVKGDGSAEIVRLTGINGEISYHSFAIEGEITDFNLDPKNWIINQYAGAEENNAILSISEKELAVNIYPNPTIDELIIEQDGLNTSYLIMDANGKTLLRGNLKSNKSSVNVSSLANGIYILSIDGKTYQFSKI